MNILSFFKLQFILWILPIVIIIQNIEMSSGLYSWLNHHTNIIPPIIKSYIGDIYAPQFKDRLNASLFLASVLPLLVVSFFNRTNDKSITRYILTMAGFMVIIGAMLKMTLVLIVQAYIPGVVTAMLLCLPISFRLVKYCFETFHFTYYTKILLFLFSIAFYLPSIWIVWLFSSIIIY